MKDLCGFSIVEREMLLDEFPGLKQEMINTIAVVMQKHVEAAWKFKPRQEPTVDPNQSHPLYGRF